MAALRNAEDRVHWFMRELENRVVAESGIPSDRFHLGKLILMSLKDAPVFVMQIDATTEESETYSSVLARTVKCATAFKKMGLKTGDNIVLMAPNHIHLAIPLYAALYLGIGVAPVDALLTVKELERIFKIIGPSVIFCQNERVAAVKEALENILIHSTVVTFNESNDCITFSDFIETHRHDVDIINTFRASDFDTTQTPALLVATSGTTGLPKVATLTHKNLVVSIPYLWQFSTNFPTPTRLALILGPVHWLSVGVRFVFSPVLRFTRLQCSEGIRPENFVKIVNKYKPSYTAGSPSLLAKLFKPEIVAKCDTSCFENIFSGGSILSKELLACFRKVCPNINFRSLYGSTEISGVAFYDVNPPPGSTGRPYGLFDYRLVDPDTKKDITEPHVNGELWLRGPSICNGYYNQPETTKEAFEEDGWFRTGDLFYRDENFFFFYVERLKLLLKYGTNKISPLELESVIRQHPGVLDVAVTGLPDPVVGELPVAFVAPKFGHKITAQEIKDIVKNNLTDVKQLRGGVVFMKELPMTASTKVNRRKLKELVTEVTRE